MESWSEERWRPCVCWRCVLRRFCKHSTVILGIQPDDLDGAVGEAGGEVAGVVGEGEAADGHARELPLADLGGRGEVPEDNAAAVADGSQGLAVGGERREPDDALMAL